MAPTCPARPTKGRHTSDPALPCQCGAVARRVARRNQRVAATWPHPRAPTTESAPRLRHLVALAAMPIEARARGATLVLLRPRQRPSSANSRLPRGMTQVRCSQCTRMGREPARDLMSPLAHFRPKIANFDCFHTLSPGLASV